MYNETNFYPTSQHKMMSIKEVLSSEEDEKFFTSLNGIVFKGVELVGTVFDPKNGTSQDGNDYTKFTLKSLDEQCEIVVFGGLHTDDELKHFMARLLDGSHVIVRGRISIKDGDDRSVTLYPKQISEVPDVRQLEYWRENVVRLRVLNGYPVIVEDGLYSVANEMDLELDECESPNLARFKYTIKGDTGEKIQVTEERKTTGVTLRARELTIPKEIAEKKKKKVDFDDIVNMIVEGSGLEREEVLEQINLGIEKVNGLLAPIGSALIMANNLGVEIDLDGVEVQHKTIKKKKTTKKLDLGIETDDPEETVIAFLEENGGTAGLTDLNVVMRKIGLDDKKTQGLLLDMFDEGKVVIKGKEVSLQ